MRQIKTFSDNRLDFMCAYCGGNTNTRDHVPSKVLLDEPYPENLPVVECCEKCNQGFSLDEEYVACLLECVICGTTDVDKLKRKKIKRILNQKESLRKRVLNSMIKIEGQTFFAPEIDRLKNVIMKLAKGHIRYENSEPVLSEEPTHWGFKALPLMSQDEIDLFLKDTEDHKLLPEVGSRAMQKILVGANNNVYSHWETVQPNNYDYCVTTNPLSVKMIIWNYLAVEVIWK